MDTVRIRLATPDGESVTATLDDGVAARAFRALLPLTVDLTDYNATEKIADLPKRLATDGEPAGVDPEPGDLAYYAPWGNLAISYKDFTYSRGLVRLGRLDRVPDSFRRPAPVQVTIEALPWVGERIDPHALILTRLIMVCPSRLTGATSGGTRQWPPWPPSWSVEKPAASID